VPVDRGRALLGGLGVVVLAGLSGVGGPPSLFRQDLSPVLELAGEYLLSMYLTAFLAALIGAVIAAVLPSVGRIVSTLAAATSLLGHTVAWLVSSDRGSMGVLVFLALFLPFVLVMWTRGPRVGTMQEAPPNDELQRTRPAQATEPRR
jgi:hypothetical protein